MKFGANTWIWFAPFTFEELDQTAARMAEAGFDIIELPIETVNAYDYHKAAEIVHNHGLDVTIAAAMAPGRDLIHPDRNFRETGLAYIRHCIEATNTLGATNLIGAFYSSVGRTWHSTAEERARNLDLLVVQLSSLSTYAADHGVVLCLEPLNRFETSFINLTSQGIEVVDRVDNSSCRLLLDTFHMNIEELSLGDAIRSTDSRIGQIHACENNRGVPGAGHVPWTDVAQALKDINYTGPVVIESHTIKVKSIPRAASVWRPLAPTQDAIAYDGLKFLKQLFD